MGRTPSIPADTALTSGFQPPDQAADRDRHEKANLVLFIVDCIDGLTAADKEIALLLRKNDVKTLLVANKADNPKADLSLAEFAKLGFGTPSGFGAQ